MTQTTKKIKTQTTKKTNRHAQFVKIMIIIQSDMLK